MSWLRRHLHLSSSGSQPTSPPQWNPDPAQEHSRKLGLLADAPLDEHIAALGFCHDFPVQPAGFVPSHLVERIEAEGCKAWEIATPVNTRFRGRIENLQKKEGGPKVVKITSANDCGDICLMSNLPLMAGQYGIQGKQGAYYEVQILKMEGTVAIGFACQPYPVYRLPGWNRLSAALHLDDLQKFFEDPEGGRHYDDRIQKVEVGDVIGCGYEYATNELFFTYNGERLNTAFIGSFAPRDRHDVYAAVGVGALEKQPGRKPVGENQLIVNFGGDDQEHLLRWKPGREWAWLPQGHVGKLGGGSRGGVGDDLPTYEEVKYS